MLVLSRKATESIILRDYQGQELARVTIAGVRGGVVSLGIAAPPDVTIDREEVDRAKRAEFTTCDTGGEG